MNLRALMHNYARSGAICAGFLDRMKYLLWLYGLVPGQGKSPGAATLGFRLPAPVGDLVLCVRCNRGSDAFVFGEVFQQHYYDFELPTPPRTILDAGANVGFTALYFARKYPDAAVACVEPMADNVRYLRLNLARNGVAARVFDNALCAGDGPVAMQTAGNDYGHKVAGIEFGRALDGGTTRVDGLSVPTLMATLGWERIGLMKIDIEGYEGVLLRERCEWLERVDAICIECHEGFGEEDLRAVGARFGFRAPWALPGVWLLTR